MSTSTEHTSPSPCDRALEYAYDELAPSDKEAFEKHLESCARCQGEVASFKRVRGAVRAALPLVEPPQPGGLHAQLLHAAAQRKPARGKVLSFPRRLVTHPGFAAAASLVLIAGVLGVSYWKGKLFMPEKAAEAPAPAVTATVEPAAPPPPVAAEIPTVGQAAPADPAAQPGEKAPPREEADREGAFGRYAAGDKNAVATATPKAKEKLAKDGAPAPAPDSSASKTSYFLSGPEGKAMKAEPKARAREAADEPVLAKPSVAPSRVQFDALEGSGGGAPQGGGKGSSVARGYREDATVPGASNAWNAETAQQQRRSPTAAPPAAAAPAPAPEPRAPGLDFADDADVKRDASRPKAPAAPAKPQAIPAPTTRAAEVETLVPQQKESSIFKQNAAAMRKKADGLAKAGRCEEAETIYKDLERMVAGFKLSVTDRLNLIQCKRLRGRLSEAQNDIDSLRTERNLNNDLILREQRALDEERAKVRPAPARKKAAPRPADSLAAESPAPAAEPKAPPSKAADKPTSAY